eukprot:tig00021521_g22073.t1
MAARPAVNFVRLSRGCILRQLHLEERLYRTAQSNWCIVLDGAARPAVVMGISGVPEKLLDLEAIRRAPIPVYRRFTGGGTVVVDEQTLFITLLFNGQQLGLQAFPREIMRWTEELYQPVFGRDFRHVENDYAYGDLKFGGNAQAISRDRWLHHTSFLWDFQLERMAYLQLPERRPAYRQSRSHGSFLCRLRDYFPSRDDLVARVEARLAERFDVRRVSAEEAEAECDPAHRCQSAEVDLSGAPRAPAAGG